MKKLISTLSIFVFLFIFGITAAFAQENETVNLCTYRSLGDFSPYTIKDDTEYEAVRFLFDSLYYIDENDRSKEMMGYDLKISDDYTEYRITLKDNLKWSDGSSVTVDDVIFTYENAKNVEWFKHCVRALDKVYAEGNTVIFKMKYPNPVFMKEAVTYMPVVPKAYYEKGDYRAIGCGAFTLNEKSENGYILKHTDYYLTSTNVDTIKIDILESEQQCAQGVINAQYATIFGNISADTFKMFNSDLIEAVDIYGLTSEVLFMNNETAFNDVALRKAVSLVIDYERIVNDIYKEEAEKGSPGFFNSRLGYANQDIGYETNIDTAKQVLSTSGYTIDNGVLKDKNLNTVNINILYDEKNQVLAEYIADTMKNLGINAAIQKVDKDQLINQVKQGNYQAAIVHLNSYYQYCESNLNLFVGNGPMNYSRYKSPKAENALAQYTSTMDASARHSYLLELQRIMLEEVPFITLCHQDSLNGYEKGLYSTISYKEGIGVYAVQSFIQNRKSIDRDANAHIIYGDETGSISFIQAGMLVSGVIIIGIVLYFVVEKVKTNKSKDNRH